MHKDIMLAAGSIIGRDHRLASKNCQDAYHINSRDEVTVCVVADGCGSGARSEVGAHIGVRLVSEALLAERKRAGSISAIRWNRVLADVTGMLGVLARQMGDSLSAVVMEHFLFTIVGVLMDETEAGFFNLGDGIILINDQQIELGPFAGNRPPYLGYNLVGTTLEDEDPAVLTFQEVAVCSLTDLDYFLVGTDGVIDLIRVEGRTQPGADKVVKPIREFADEKCFSNEALLSRRLLLVERDWHRRDHTTGSQILEAGLLPDDTTMIVGKRLDA